MTKTRSEPAAPPERRLIDVRAVARLAGGVTAATVSGGPPTTSCPSR